MKNIIRLLFFTVCIVIFSTSCSNEPELDLYCSINGQVTDMQTGEPIQAASITLTPGGLTTVSGSDGTFEFINLDPGQYDVIVQAYGYYVNRKSVKAVVGESHRVDIPLTKQ